METSKALEMARREGLDLAEISPTAKPPVCKILDYGKFKYEAKKKAKEAKKRQVQTTLKEVQFRPGTDDHDVAFKVKHIQRFLGEGHKVRVYVRFRGREASHAELGRALLNQIVDLAGELSMVEQHPKMEGRIMAMILAPSTKVTPKKKPKAASPKASTESKTKVPAEGQESRTSS